MSNLSHFRTIGDLNNEGNHSWAPDIFLRYCMFIPQRDPCVRAISDTGLTKLVDILYVTELHRRLYPDPSLSNITTLSLHSGWVNTWCNKLGP